ncbi:unnamed protein product [Parnassius apollo]|uniref:(apollo) hypothetical protein n=1 Tax=Parnassius apollo TaxID=110799 RepID=A0A8S3YAH4_PARAO|nr:unnamed protein product [Parnassius apollo]
MASARRSWRLDSKEIFDVLVNDVDSDIEEDPEIQIEEVIQDLHEVVSVQDHENDDADMSENVSEPEQGRSRGRSRPTLRGRTRSRGGRVRSGARSTTRCSSGRHASTSIREMDEANGWSYEAVQQPPENPVFQEISRVLAPIDENSSLFDCFSIFFPDSFWKLLKTKTNRYAAQMKAKQTRQGILKPGTMLYQWKPVTKQELKTFFSVVIHMTLVQKESFDSYWSTREIIETSFARKHMNRNRFRAIYSCLHLNDNSNYKPRNDPEYDAFFKLRPYFDELCFLCENSFYPNENLTIDEGTCGFRGRVHFRVYNKDKPDKYGMKVYMLCDAETGYILRMVPYVGDSKSVETIIAELSEPYFGKWHTIYMDRFFTSPTIADLLWLKETRTVGTVMANRRGLPQVWRQQPLEKAEMAFCHRGNLTACKWKDKRDVLMLTTKHGASWTEVDTKAKGVGVTKKVKPDCILDYNHYKIGVDLNDQYVSYYSLNRKSMKWWKKMFFNLVARSLVNAYILYNKSREQRRRLRFSQFLMDSGEQLVETASDAEAGPSHGPHAVGTSTRLVGRHFIERIPSSEKKEKVARVCKVCADISKKETGKRGRKETIYYCPDCNVPLCYYPCFKMFHTQKKLRSLVSSSM